MVPCFLDLWIFSVHLEWPSFCSDPPDLARPLHGTATQPGHARSKKIFDLTTHTMLEISCDKFHLRLLLDVKMLFDYNYSVKYFGNIWDMFHLCFLYSRFCWASPCSHGLNRRHIFGLRKHWRIRGGGGPNLQNNSTFSTSLREIPDPPLERKQYRNILLKSSGFQKVMVVVCGLKKR